MTGDAVVSSEVRGNPTKTIFTGAPLQSLATIASMDDNGDLYLIVINNNLNDRVAADINLGSFSPSGSGSVWTLNGSGFRAFNNVEHPNRVSIVERPLDDVKDSFAYTFPAHSITALKIDRASP
jgi:alpha-N-arabinofuranosidase